MLHVYLSLATRYEAGKTGLKKPQFLAWISSSQSGGFRIKNCVTAAHKAAQYFAWKRTKDKRGSLQQLMQ